MRAAKSNGVFISHTGSDRDFAERLASDLQAIGLTVWLDSWELRVGDSIIGRIESGIRRSTWMIVVLSPRAVRSQWVLKELRAGLAREVGTKKVFVLPALCKSVALPSFLRDKYYADFTKSYEQGLRHLSDTLLAPYRHKTSEHWLLVGGRKRRPGSGVAVKERWRYVEKSLVGLEAILSPVGPFTLGGDKGSTLARSASQRKSEIWFGRSGRLILRRSDRLFSGSYDWHGYSLAGRIKGRVERDCLVFDWDWSMSSERGGGIFWTTIPGVLHGGWWMDYYGVDEQSVREGELAPPHRWEFTNVDGLRISEYG